jgi:uncharacterized membrane protein YozB (DUF420 family)
MNLSAKVVGLNLLVLVAYTVLVHLSQGEREPYREVSIAILLAMILAVHTVGALLTGGILYWGRNNKPMGKAFFLSAGVVLLVGFSTCMGSGVVMGMR